MDPVIGEDGEGAEEFGGIAAGFEVLELVGVRFGIVYIILPLPS